MMQDWFLSAKFGIFLHWGIYAVKGVSESWSFYNRQLTYEDYLDQANGFTASNYDPKAWAKLFRESGARYAVLTTKHHDGVALWDTQLSDLSSVKKTPAARDLIHPFCAAMREAGLKVGLYFSHLDWSHPDYPSVFPKDGRKVEPERLKNAHSFPQGSENPDAWQRFLQFHRGQLRELCTNYGKVDLLWFDGDWERDKQQWNMEGLRKDLHSWQPQVILNSRMQGHGDYETPEQGVPILPPDGPWEFCVTMNDSWGWQGRDKNYKSTRQLIQMLCECIGMGGNLLLGIGPKEDGTFVEEQGRRLQEIGAWISRHEEAVYPTKAGLPSGHFYGATALNQQENIIYLYLFDRPWDSVSLKGIRNKIKRISLLGKKMDLAHKRIGGASWLNIPGVIWITVPEEQLDPNTTVLKVELEGKLDLYRGSGGAIEVN